jgi:hypothetical protein
VGINGISVGSPVIIKGSKPRNGIVKEIHCEGMFTAHPVIWVQVGERMLCVGIDKLEKSPFINGDNFGKQEANQTK